MKHQTRTARPHHTQTTTTLTISTTTTTTTTGRRADLGYTEQYVLQLLE